MDLKLLKKIITNRASTGGYLVCISPNNPNYVYVTNEDKVIIFSSDYECIRFNRIMDGDENASKVKDLLREMADKLGRKYIEAEWPVDYMSGKNLAKVNGNWDPKVLAPNGASGARNADVGINRPDTSFGQVFSTNGYLQNYVDGLFSI